MDVLSIVTVVGASIGTIAIVWWTFKSLRESRERFEDFQRKYGDGGLVGKAGIEYHRHNELNRPDTRWKHNLKPSMPLVTLEDMEYEEPDIKADRPSRKIDV